MQKLIMADANFERTIGKLEGTLELLEARLRDIDLTLKTHLQSTATLAPRIDAIEDRVKKLEDGTTWIVTKVFGIVVTALIGLVIIKFGIPLPK